MSLRDKKKKTKKKIRSDYFSYADNRPCSVLYP